jgi:membrane-associated phospholipid phosphatase
VAVAGVVLLALVWFLAFYGGPFRRVDRSVLDGFTSLANGRWAQVADAVPHIADPQPFALFGFIIVGVALYRRRGRVAIAAGTILIGANATTQVLKTLLAHARSAGLIANIDPDAWPSGHATASMSLVLAAVLVASLRWRPYVAALGLVGTLTVTFTLLVAAWHFPSDVIGGYLVAGIWTAAALGVLWTIDGHRSQPVPRGQPLSLAGAVGPLIGVAVSAFVLAGLVLLARPERVTDYAREHTVFVAGAAFIAALGFALAAVMSAAMTSTREPVKR